MPGLCRAYDAAYIDLEECCSCFRLFGQLHKLGFLGSWSWFSLVEYGEFAVKCLVNSWGFAQICVFLGGLLVVEINRLSLKALNVAKSPPWGSVVFQWSMSVLIISSA
jgi:hypothetical protein